MDALPAALTAIPLGVAFGFVLERAGLGDPRVIRGQLKARDFTVLRVMFGAIVTCMLGVLLLSAAGVIEREQLAAPPTLVAGQLLGAVIFGGGFALATLCPGTACVAAASGRREGFATVGGVFAGTLLVPAVWPLVGPAASGTPAENADLAQSLHIPAWGVAALITVLAILAFRVARRIEGAGRGPWWRLTTIEAVVLTLLGALAIADRGTDDVPLATIAAAIEREEDHVHALELAEWIREGRAGLRILDVREHLDTGTYMIPGARAVAMRDVASLAVDPDDRVVLYSDGGAHAAQAWVLLRARGVRNALVLKDGMAAWEDDVLQPVIPTATDDSTRRAFDRVRELSLWFGGKPRVGGGVFEAATRHAAPARRRRTC